MVHPWLQEMVLLNIPYLWLFRKELCLLASHRFYPSRPVGMDIGEFRFHCSAILRWKITMSWTVPQEWSTWEIRRTNCRAILLLKAWVG
mmetsp:Transcript_17699/g.54450  ORF Transcript_17699/g.54450 Transcript_17699/m.54450 type:complete len:89 (+) Transcript_17699:1519-1785(+)